MDSTQGTMFDQNQSQKMKTQFAQQHQLYLASPSLDYSQTTGAMMPAAHRNLPTVPVLPSTPGISRPGSSGSMCPIGSFGQDLGWAPASPRSIGFGSPASVGRPSLTDPMVSGFDGEELNPLTPVTPGTESANSSFNFHSTEYSLSPAGSTPTTPALTHASTPGFEQSEACDPRALTVPDSVSPTLAPAFVDDAAFTFTANLNSVNPTALSSPPFDFDQTFCSEAGEENSLVSTTFIESLCSDELEMPVQVPCESSPRKRSRADSDAFLNLPETIPEEPERKTIKTEPGAEAPTSPVAELSTPSSAEAASPLDTATPSEEDAPVKLEAGSGPTNVIPGPPPQNRRGRKQSFSNDPTKQFACNVCSRRFRRQEHLKRHHRSLHTHDKPYRCDECGKSFSRSDNLAQHQRTHGSGTFQLEMVPQDFHQTMHAQYASVPTNVMVHLGTTLPGSGDEARPHSASSHVFYQHPM